MKDLVPGQQLTIKAYSKIFRDTYRSKIVEIQPRGIVIETPTRQGRLILMGAGTIMEVSVHTSTGQLKFEAELLERSNTNEFLLISRPDSISRGKRVFNESSSRVIAFTSGKGGVGKSTLTINFALSLIEQGFSVAIIDADLGTANLDIMLNIKTKSNISQVIFGQNEIEEIVVEGPQGLLLVPGGSGFQELTELSDWQFARLINSFNFLDKRCDFILIDTGAGLSRNVTNFLLAADEIIVVTTPEPHCITDGYAIIKVISELKKEKPFLHLIVNKAENDREGREVGLKMTDVTRRFLDLNINFLGTVPDDRSVVKANKQRIPVVLNRPSSKATKSIKMLTGNYLDLRVQGKDVSGPKASGFTGFLNRVKSLIKEGLS